MPGIQRPKENNPNVVPIKSLTKEQIIKLAQQFQQGKLIPSTMTTTDDGSKIVRPVLTQVAL
jgi:hypothetical protein